MIGLVRDAIAAPLTAVAERRLNSMERCGTAEIQSFAHKKLEILVARFWEQSQWYRGKCAGARTEAPPRVTVGTEIRTLPILTKDAMRTFIADDGPANRVHGILGSRVTTGGSTGAPLPVLKSLGDVVWSEAAYRRGRRWAGIRPGARGLHLKTLGRASILGRARQRLMGFRSLAAYPQNPGEIAAVVDFIRSWRPDFVTGYPTSLLAVARAAPGKSLGGSIVWTTGEALLPGQREEIAAAFGGAVYQYYGSNEVSSIAFECPERRLHVVGEHVIVEILDADDQPVVGVPGRVVVTDLDNTLMPFIRYELGDIAVLSTEPCPCGLPHATIEEIQGRTQDALTAPDGRTLPAVFFASRFRDLRAIEQYQLEQFSDGSIELRWVGPAAEGAAEAAEIASTVHGHLGAEVGIRIARVRTIELSPRGKSRLVIGAPPPIQDRLETDTRED